MEITLTPVYKLYYSSDTTFGVYSFHTPLEIEYNDGTVKDLDGNMLYKGILTGNMQELTLGVQYKALIKECYSKKYGKYQYEPLYIVPIVPKTTSHQSKFLRTIVTEKQANVLLEAYPNIVQMIIDQEEVDLSKTKGVKFNTFSKIKQAILDTYVDSDIYVMLKPLGVTPNMIKKLKLRHPNPIILKQKLTENPYAMTEIRGLGFKKVDDLALKLNPSLRTSMYRLKAYLTHKLNEIGDSDGHTRVSFQTLENYVRTEMGLCYELYEELFEKELNDPKLFNIDAKHSQIGLMSHYKTESEILNRLKTLQESKSKLDTSVLNFELAFSQFEKSNGYALTDEQKQAVMSLRDNNVAIICGSAGTGKSSVIDAIIKVFNQVITVEQITQCALSAKASRRMTEVTGLESRTIHSLIYGNTERDEDYESKRINSELIIVDEFSMVNAQISRDLLLSVQNGSKLVFCFDDAQLPPIGYGNVATDLLQSKFNINRLTKVHRQAQASGILSDANIIRTGVNPIKTFQNTLITGGLRDMYYSFKNEKQDIFNTVMKYYMKSIDSLGVDDVCICVPRKEQSLVSTESFNIAIQEELLGHIKNQIVYGGSTFKLGCKLIQRANNKEKGIVNGEIGKLTKIDHENKDYFVDFGGDKVVKFGFSDIKDMELAYAISIHASQGSQYHTVIVALAMDSYMLLSKELLYTSITRAKKRCMVVAEPKSFDISCKKHASKRNTWLQLLLKKEISSTK